jgi:predicted porin
MKKSLLALAALTAFAGVASAQSSVTLFGVVDLAARNVKNGSTGSVKSLVSGSNATSRFGLRGVEDLGGGLRAGFWLEGDVLADTGAGGAALFGRRSTVSVMGGFGEVRLGRDYTPSFWNYAVFDPFGYIGVGAITPLLSTLNSGAQSQVRSSNSIGYFLPALGGLYGQAQVAAGEGVAGNKYFGGRLGYAAGPVNVAVAYGKTDRDGAMVDDYTDMNVGASFNIGFMTLMGVASKREYSNLDQKTYLIGAAVPLGAGTIKASYVKASGSNQSLDATKMQVGYVYDLSKRTALYTHASRLNNDGNAVNGANFTIPGGPAAGIGRGQTSTGYEFGIRHSF